MKNIFKINVDLKKSVPLKTPIFTEGDSVVFEVSVFDDGKVFDLSNASRCVLLTVKPDGNVTAKNGKVTGVNKVKFDLGYLETSVVGKIKSIIQVYDLEGRVSSFSFNFVVKNDPSNDYVSQSPDTPLLQTLINDTTNLINVLTQKADYAKAQGDYAKTQGDYAKAQIGILMTYEEPLNPTWLFKGINFTSYIPGGFTSARADEALERMKSIGVDTIGVNQFSYMDTYTSNSITSDRIPPTDVETAIQKAKARGFKVMLKPVVNVRDGTWRARIAPTDTDIWFNNYTTWLMNYVNMAARNDVEIFCIGTELISMGIAKYRAKWESLISQIRSVYNGKLTYAANLSDMYDLDEINTCSFWDLVDYLGLDVWIGHTNKNDPTVDELIESWANNKDGRGLVQIILDWQKKHGKPVLFTECGITAQDGANKRIAIMWNYTNIEEDVQEQADWYQAFFEVWKYHTDILKGVFFWQVNAENINASYSFELKPAQTVIETYWKTRQ